MNLGWFDSSAVALEMQLAWSTAQQFAGNSAGGRSDKARSFLHPEVSGSFQLAQATLLRPGDDRRPARKTPMITDVCGVSLFSQI